MSKNYFDKFYKIKVECECGKTVMISRMANHICSLEHERLMSGKKFGTIKKDTDNSFYCKYCEASVLNKNKKRHYKGDRHLNNKELSETVDE